MWKRYLAMSLALTLVVGGLSTCYLNGRQAPATPAAHPDEKAVHAALEAFVNAFNEGDAKKMAAALTPDAEMISESGQGLRGRDTLQKVYEQFLTDNKGAKLHVTLEGPRFVAPTVALEDGESVVTVVDKGTQSARRYAMTYVKLDGKWLIGSLREYPELEEETTDEQYLKEFEWMLGEWVDEGPDSAVVINCRYSDDKRYLLRDYEIKLKGVTARKGTQRIGVDPLTGLVKGWAFDSEGGHGETTWVKNGDEWIAKATGISPEGDVTSATYLIKPIGKDKVYWKTMHRIVADRVEPDLEVTMVRRAPKPQ